VIIIARVVGGWELMGATSEVTQELRDELHN